MRMETQIPTLCPMHALSMQTEDGDENWNRSQNLECHSFSSTCPCQFVGHHSSKVFLAHIGIVPSVIVWGAMKGEMNAGFRRRPIYSQQPHSATWGYNLHLFSHGAMFLPELRPDEVFSQMPWVLTMSGCFFLARRLADLSFLCVDGSGESWVRVKVDSWAARPSPDILAVGGWPQLFCLKTLLLCTFEQLLHGHTLTQHFSLNGLRRHKRSMLHLDSRFLSQDSWEIIFRMTMWYTDKTEPNTWIKDWRWRMYIARPHIYDLYMIYGP